MKIIEPSVELWKQENDIAHAVRCARVCYKRESGNDEATYKRLIESKHYSVFRHASYYYIVPKYKIYPQIIDSFIDVVDVLVYCHLLCCQCTNRKVQFLSVG